MTVGELIETLSKLNPKHEVRLQTDPEGNGYYELAGAEETMFDDDGAALHPDDWDDMGVFMAVVVYP